MPDLPARPNLDQLRHQAKDLLHAARFGNAEALARIAAVSEVVRLSSAQLAVAREYGFSSWAALKLEVQRRDILNRGDAARLVELLAAHPDLAMRRLEHWSDGNRNRPLAYVTKMRFYRDHSDHSEEVADVSGTGALARALLAAGAPVNGRRRDKETPLITAASYGDVEVAQVLIEAGADLDATSATDSGGVPGGSALLHAAVFGMTEIVDLLVAAGARVDSLEMAAAAGDIRAWPLADADLQTRIRALVFAGDHQRLDVIDRLVTAGTPVNQPDSEFHRLPLHVAAQHGRPASIRRLLEQGADPNLADPDGHTALELCTAPAGADCSAYEEAAAILRPLTTSSPHR